MTVRDVAEQIAVADQRTEIEALCEEAIEEIEVALHHVHGPKLSEAGYVEYDPDRQLLGLTRNGRQLSVETECDDRRVDDSEGITVELCTDTIDSLHEAIKRDDRLGARMSYDEVISTLLADRTRSTTDTDADGERWVTDEEEAR
jgi:hypothetical protein